MSVQKIQESSQRGETRKGFVFTWEGSGAPGGSRTPDLLVRSQTLYPAELRARSNFLLCFNSLQQLPEHRQQRFSVHSVQLDSHKPVFQSLNPQFR